MLMPRHFKQKKTLNERLVKFANDARVHYCIAVFGLGAATILMVALLVFQTGVAR